MFHFFHGWFCPLVTCRSTLRSASIFSGLRDDSEHGRLVEHKANGVARVVHHAKFGKLDLFGVWVGGRGGGVGALTHLASVVPKTRCYKVVYLAGHTADEISPTNDAAHGRESRSEAVEFCKN